MPDSVDSTATSESQETKHPIADWNRQTRIGSIDIFRGLTILVMIFVNDLAGVRGLPWWTYHMPGDANGMTYVDMVFPFFLFVVGISLPMAIGRRISRGDSWKELWFHIIARSLALVVLGIALANFENLDASRSHIGSDLWLGLIIVGAILFWVIYPRSDRFRTLFRSMRGFGLLMMLAMFMLFRRLDQQGHDAWLDFGYWEILGLIGWTYLGVSLLYIPMRRWRWTPIAMLIIFATLNTASSAHILRVERLPFYLWPWNNGCFCLMTTAGILTSTIVFENAFGIGIRRKVWLAAASAWAMLSAGWLLSPLGISKIRATPSWGFYSAGAATLCFLLLYWICDLRNRQRWALFVRAAGSNTLLTYLLPDLFFVTIGGLAISSHWQSGWQGVIKSAVFTGLILFVSSVLTRFKIRLQL